MDAPDQKYSEAAAIAMKIAGAIIAVISFRWVAKIFAGPDGRLNVIEFGRMIGCLFFLAAGGYMLWKEGNRTHEYHLYSEWYIAIVFGSLLTTLHLDRALDNVTRILEALVNMKRKNVEVPPQP